MGWESSNRVGVRVGFDAIFEEWDISGHSGTFEVLRRRGFEDGRMKSRERCILMQYDAGADWGEDLR